jgi:hypothetical protein
MLRDLANRVLKQVVAPRLMMILLKKNFDSSNAVLGMAFTHTPLEKAIAFCTAETNFVLHSKQNKNKDRKSSYYCQKVEILFSKSRPKFEKRREKVVIKFEKGGKKS